MTTYKLDKHYLYIKRNNEIQGIPLKELTNEELGAIMKTLVQEGATHDEDMHLELKYEK